jgi:uncharacterized membrane protein YheB (UPF0754 family)
MDDNEQREANNQQTFHAALAWIARSNDEEMLCTIGKAAWDKVKALSRMKCTVDAIREQFDQKLVEAVETAVSEILDARLDTAVKDAVGNVDFDKEVEKAVEEAMDSLDLSDQIEAAVNDLDLSDQVNAAVDQAIEDRLDDAVKDAVEEAVTEAMAELSLVTEIARLTERVAYLEDMLAFSAGTIA